KLATATNVLLGNNTGSDLASANSETSGNLVGTAASPFDPKLLPLADNGGPTPTHALRADSLAINAGANPDNLATDQRGQPRVSGVRADIGAFELQLSGVPNPGGVPQNLIQAAQALSHSREYYSNFVTAAYNRFLGRQPEPTGLTNWIGAMQQGLTDETLEAGFIGSPEYIANHGGQGAGWVRGMYKDLLGRDPLQSEVDAWVRALNMGVSTTEVAHGFAASLERESQHVQGNYQRYLGRPAA